MAGLIHPANLKYTKTDEWVRVEGNLATIGITDYAQDQLGDIVYVELPWDLPTLIQEDKFGDIESVKATSELLLPVSGEIINVNETLKESPEFINDSPYEDGWMLVVKISDPSELDNLMSAAEYEAYIQGR
jgi:glycine cleavage system H protein